MLAVGGASLSAQSLDQQLFEDLVESQEEVATDEAARQSYQKPRQQILQGNSISHPPRSHPLTEMVKQMRQVRDRLVARDTTAATRQLQSRIVTDLEQLIETLQDQQQKGAVGGNQKHHQSQQQNHAMRKRSQQPGFSSATKSNEAADRSETQQDGTKQGQSLDVQAKTESRDQLMQSSWGNLPPSTRQQMQSARPERFLPKYERLIEDYYRRLAEGQE